ncbi:MAG: alpha/beta fold hydrolase [Candidatus Eisenbacteria bacterium]|nr:alpha/beta fold hydrolase [Candidatus Eisenbacteria bacterium]
MTVENRAAGVKLAGTLTKPRGAGPFPAALLITGSGAQNRDEELAGHRPFLVLADHLTRHGLAVLRLDDRGAGKSTGTFAAATSRDFAGDARAAVEFLKRRPEVDRARIGLVGHSEGGLIAPMLAAGSRDIAFIVLMAGPGLPGEWILIRQGELLNRAAGAPDSIVALSRAAQESTFAIVKAEPDTAAAARRIRELAGRMFARVGGDQTQAGSAMQRRMEQQAGFVTSAWFRFFLTYDPVPALKQVKCPVLALNGAKDLQVPPKEDLAAIAGALKAGGNRDFQTVELPNLNHLFQTSATGSVAEYGTIEETIAPAALDTMTAWIEAHVKK